MPYTGEENTVIGNGSSFNIKGHGLTFLTPLFHVDFVLVMKSLLHTSLVLHNHTSVRLDKHVIVNFIFISFSIT